MKKTLLAFCFLLTVMFRAEAQIVINEIMYNPPESGVDSLEYIEFYNVSNAPVNLEGWSIFGVTFVFPAVTLAPGKYIVTGIKPAAIQTIFGKTALAWAGGALTNGGETIKLLNAGGTVIDEVTYSNAAPWPLEANGGGASLVLCDPNSDNSNVANWQACTTAIGVMINGKDVKGNPDAASNCSGSNVLSATNDNVNVPSGTSKNINVLGNDLTPKPITAFSILAGGPTHGTATIITGNYIKYTPAAGYCGPDVFKYKVCDASGCDTATVNIKVICYKSYTIGQVIGESATTGVADSIGVYTELKGTVYGFNLRPGVAGGTSLLFTIIDDAGNGIAVSSLNGDFAYNVVEKDKVTVRGVIGQFNGQIEIQPDTVIKNSANNPLLAATLSIKLSEATESKLVRFTNLHLVNPATWTTGLGASGFTCQAVSNDHLSDTITIRIDRDVETYNAPAPPEPFNLTGIGGQFDNSSPYLSGYQVLPRYNADISTLNAVQNVDFSAQVHLSPNPAYDILNIRSDIQFDRILIMGAEGRIVHVFNNPNLLEQINTSKLPSGAYFVRMEKDGTAWTTRFVKM
jgi:hypothetical protein